MGLTVLLILVKKQCISHIKMFLNSKMTSMELFGGMRDKRYCSLSEVVNSQTLLYGHSLVVINKPRTSLKILQTARCVLDSAESTQSCTILCQSNSNSFLSQVIIELGCSHWAAALGGFLATFGEIFIVGFIAHRNTVSCV